MEDKTRNKQEVIADITRILREFDEKPIDNWTRDELLRIVCMIESDWWFLGYKIQ